MDAWCNWFSIRHCHCRGSASHCGFESRRVRKLNTAVAQLVRADVLYTSGSGFKSLLQYSNNFNTLI